MSFNDWNIYIKISIVLQNIAGVVALVGVAANALVFGLFFSSALRKHSYSFYCQAKALTDALILLDILLHWNSSLTGVIVQNLSMFLCSLIICLRHWANTCGLWLLVLISLDRLVTVVYPNLFRFLKRRRSQISVVVVVSVFSCFANAIIPMNTRWHEIPNFTFDGKKLYYVTRTGLKTHTWIMFGHMIGLVLLANTIVNVKLIWYMISSRMRVARHSKTTTTITKTTGRRNTTNRRERRDRKFAISAIGIGLVAFFCKTIIGVCNVVLVNFTLDLNVYTVIYNVGFITIAVESGSSFWVNLYLNSVFRGEFKRVFARCFNKPAQMTPAISSGQLN